MAADSPGAFHHIVQAITESAAGAGGKTFSIVCNSDEQPLVFQAKFKFNLSACGVFGDVIQCFFNDEEQFVTHLRRYGTARKAGLDSEPPANISAAEESAGVVMKIGGEAFQIVA